MKSSLCCLVFILQTEGNISQLAVFNDLEIIGNISGNGLITFYGGNLTSTKISVQKGIISFGEGGLRKRFCDVEIGRKSRVDTVDSPAHWRELNDCNLTVNVMGSGGRRGT